MMTILDASDLEEPTVVVRRAFLALHVNDEAERRSGEDARELFEDATRIARGVSWGLGVVSSLR